jgi:hypothetical protein
MIEAELFRALENSAAPVAPAALDIRGRIGFTKAHRAWDRVLLPNLRTVRQNTLV